MRLLRARRPLVVAGIVALSCWLMKDDLLYRHGIWRLAHAADEGEVAEYSEQIEEMGDRAVSGLVATYDETAQPNRVRRAAARALMKSDATLAEAVFGRHLDDPNTEASAMAIRDLGVMKSGKYRGKILEKLGSGNEVVRWSVVDYLGHFADADSVALLERIMAGDESSMVREAAARRLGGRADQAEK